MTCKTLKEFLDDQDVKYVSINHSRAYTAQEIAESAHVSGNDFAKVVMLNADEKMIMAVLPAPDKVELKLLRQVLGVRHVIFADENDFQDHFPGCEVGAMPPFGNLFGIRVILAKTLCSSTTISFNSGVHTEIIQMDYDNYIKLVNPEIMDFTRHIKLVA
ncbi:MAG: YbaK/EbsC family protein [gamma proteobacterium symbiont of Bathyaustriella thionipta]|nr:YbaK/EbsC family protein [gamma proteobacterium symbiont of Bathyaustriella thionipta]MCU7951393.1 YbaK/EbsC family protein [gamma proteobacterium symbiont of Bathyaustriella thionipta]MCU7951963.1 YbaK/EbsC family protein [gamma proteobacterium symbiont of Bathyaustriella thionipta]MCU7957943.1 YbaK/EbsC family protein [gamma proteobacterium symbiont of Bathyaustriella thionipta]MCU7966560.1 YbaK/EbsC family protein [gamma proteobacterium symbiont of Bathyaustriella thionipta]